MIHIVIADDEPRTREGIKRVLEGWLTDSYHIALADNGVMALELLQQQPVDLLISDIRMPGLSGLELVEQLSAYDHKPHCIFISGYSEFSYAQQAIQLDAVDYLLKPLEKQEILAAVSKALQRRADKQAQEQWKKVTDVQLAELKQETHHAEINKALHYVRENIGEQISAKQLAEMLHMNANYFSQLFKEQMGISFSDYVTRQRLQLAKRLLLTTSMSVQGIAEQAGYQSDRYFIRVFRAHEQLSPAQFRKQR
ncbi:response regulator [Paenibacillus sp. 1P07SE]|uniref:response regulator n=1 Tax=Paenibacillus sp. 1P07SE TaxID=3132209 RepID=UPI0039A54152